jgi:hypothetical protein
MCQRSGAIKKVRENRKLHGTEWRFKEGLVEENAWQGSRRSVEEEEEGKLS